MSLATVEDLEVSLMRSLTDEELKYAPALLDRAERLLLSRDRDLLRRAAAEQPCAVGLRNLIADVEAEMVARVLRAPGGGIYRQESEGNYSYSANLQVASGLLDVLDSELEKLGIGGVRTVMPATDAYLRSRRDGRPDLAYQYDWNRTYPGAWDVQPGESPADFDTSTPATPAGEPYSAPLLDEGDWR